MLKRQFLTRTASKLFAVNSFRQTTVTPYQCIAKRNHTTDLMTGTDSDFDGRLRLNEERYCDKYSTAFKQPFANLLDSISQETRKNYSNAHMMVSSVQAKLLRDLVALLRPNQVLEIGGFTGFSAVAMASALRPNSKILSLELERENVEFARRKVASANLQHLITFKEGLASESLQELARETPGVQYDFILLDADKGGYINYFDLIMEHNLLSDNGVLFVDNVLFFGQVHKTVPEFDHDEDTSTKASKNIMKVAAKVHKFNEHVANDPRVECVILPVFDGISIIRKK